MPTASKMMEAMTATAATALASLPFVATVPYPTAVPQCKETAMKGGRDAVTGCEGLPGALEARPVCVVGVDGTVAVDLGDGVEHSRQREDDHCVCENIGRRQAAEREVD